jgi:hypothetical protein
MMRFTEWLSQKWRRSLDPQLGQAYLITFSTIQGRQVLQHLLDEVYCQTCPVHDPIALATHNGRRSVVQEILENIDLAERPDKYTPREDVTHDRVA